MSRPPNEAIPSLLAALILGDLLRPMPPKKPSDGAASAGQASPQSFLDALLASCDDPTATEGITGSTDTATRYEGKEIISDPVEISPELAELVGIVGPDFDPDTPEGHTRLLAAALIANVRKLGEVPTKSFHETGAKLSGMAYAEKSVLSALRTFTELAK